MRETNTKLRNLFEKETSEIISQTTHKIEAIKGQIKSLEDGKLVKDPSSLRSLLGKEESLQNRVSITQAEVISLSTLVDEFKHKIETMSFDKIEEIITKSENVTEEIKKLMKERKIQTTELKEFSKTAEDLTKELRSDLNKFFVSVKKEAKNYYETQIDRSNKRLNIIQNNMNNTNNDELVELRKKVAKLTEGTNAADMKKIRHEMESLKANINDLFERSNLTLFTIMRKEKQNGVAKKFKLELFYKKIWERYNELEALHKRHFNMLEKLNQGLKDINNHTQELKLTTKEQQECITNEIGRLNKSAYEDRDSFLTSKTGVNGLTQ